MMLNDIDLSRFDLNLLVLFQRVLQEGHVARAARRLHVTPSAVSHGLKRLRELLDDPLFLRTPKGVVPTERALALAEPIAEVLARVSSIASTAAPFDPSTVTRRFTLGAPDGVSAVFIPPLLEALRRSAPGIDLAVRQLLPAERDFSPELAWRSAFVDLDARAMDIAIVPSEAIPARFHGQTLYEEEFVIVTRAGHPFAASPTLHRYCTMDHLVVSLTGDPKGFVDAALAKADRTRRVSLTVPNFMLALALVAGTELIAAVPGRFAAAYATRFSLNIVKAPLPLPSFRLNAVLPKVALQDAGSRWLLGVLAAASRPSRDSSRRARRRARAKPAR